MAIETINNMPQDNSREHVVPRDSAEGVKFFEIKNPDQPKENWGEVKVTSLPADVDYVMVHDFRVNEDQRGKGLGSQLMDKVEDYLEEKRVPGVLVDGITSASEGAYDMYSRRGWQGYSRRMKLYIPFGLELSDQDKSKVVQAALEKMMASL